MDAPLHRLGLALAATLALGAVSAAAAAQEFPVFRFKDTAGASAGPAGPEAPFGIGLTLGDHADVDVGDFVQIELAVDGDGSDLSYRIAPGSSNHAGLSTNWRGWINGEVEAAGGSTLTVAVEALRGGEVVGRSNTVRLSVFDAVEIVVEGSGPDGNWDDPSTIGVEIRNPPAGVIGWSIEEHVIDSGLPPRSLTELIAVETSDGGRRASLRWRDGDPTGAIGTRMVLLAATLPDGRVRRVPVGMFTRWEDTFRTASGASNTNGYEPGPHSPPGAPLMATRLPDAPEIVPATGSFDLCMEITAASSNRVVMTVVPGGTTHAVSYGGETRQVHGTSEIRFEAEGVAGGSHCVTFLLDPERAPSDRNRGFFQITSNVDSMNEDPTLRNFHTYGYVNFTTTRAMPGPWPSGSY